MKEFRPHKQGERYKTEEERRKGRVLASHKYSTKKYWCDKCKKELSYNNKSTHEKSKIHQSNLL